MSSAPPAAQPRHLGTLAAVVLKAKNLPNKRSIGKQDPFAVLSFGSEKQKTKPDKRGGQHPTWDEQLHFEIHEDTEDMINQDADAASGKAGASSSSPTKKPAAGKKVLKVACYADDNREPDFIGEGLVDLSGVLKTGEFDEWVTIKAKDRYAGEVYLELTFFSSAPRPRRMKKPKPSNQGPSYAGSGPYPDYQSSDTSTDVPPALRPYPPASGGPPREGHQHGKLSTSSTTSMLARPLGEPSTGMRPSASLAGLATYTPPYAPMPASSPQPNLPSSSTTPAVSDLDRRNSMTSASGPPYGQMDHHQSMYAAPPTPTSHQQPSQLQEYPYGSQHQLQPSQGMSNSYSTSSVISNATVRPASTQPPASTNAYEDPMNDLIRPMTSMSVGSAGMGTTGRPMPPPQRMPSPAPSPYQQYPSSTPSGAENDYGSTHHQHRPSSSYDFTNRPTSAASSHYSVAAEAPLPSPYAPTPPPHPSSAPPGTAPYIHHAPSYQSQPPTPQHQPPPQAQYGIPPSASYGASPTPSYYGSQHQPPPAPAPPQVHPAQTFIPSHGSLAALPTASSTDPRWPQRPMSSSSYHALPPLPGHTQQHPSSSQQAQQPPSGAYGYGRAPSPSPRPQPLPTPPPLPPSGSTANVQSMYYDHQSQPHPSPQPPSSSYYDPNAGRAPSPGPPSAFAQPHHQPSYYENGSTTPMTTRPMPLRQPSGAYAMPQPPKSPVPPPSSAHQRPTSPYLPPSQSYSQHAPPPPHSYHSQQAPNGPPPPSGGYGQDPYPYGAPPSHQNPHAYPSQPQYQPPYQPQHQPQQHYQPPPTPGQPPQHYGYDTGSGAPPPATSPRPSYAPAPASYHSQSSSTSGGPPYGSYHAPPY
ncbi:unnamed protein product [Jaminaea pallidilutea]